jgi:molecular chaperone IbpA
MMNSLVKDFFGFDPFAEHMKALEFVKDRIPYPKYNLVKADDGSFSLEIAVAGFKKEDLDVEQRNNTLVIEGKSREEARSYIHKGISSKPFKLLFPLSVDWKLKQVSLLDGILKFTFMTACQERSEKIAIQTIPEPAQLTQESV